MKGVSPSENFTRSKRMEKSVVDELIAIFGKENVLTANEDMIAYSYDAAHVEVKPEAVVFPTATEQVSQLMKLAYRENIPVTPEVRAADFLVDRYRCSRESCLPWTG